MKNILRFFAVAMVAALASVAAIANAETYTITNQTFESITTGSLAAPAFGSLPIIVGYGETDDPANGSWTLVQNFPITVESNNGNQVLGDSGGPVLFQLEQNTVFTSFSVTAVATNSPFASTAARGYFQSLSGTALGSFTFNQTVTSALTLTIPAGTGAIVLPIDSQYDNLSLIAVTVPEASTVWLALAGIAITGGAVMVRRKIA